MRPTAVAWVRIDKSLHYRPACAQRPALPCQSRNNSNETPRNSNSKAAFALELNVKAFYKRHGWRNVGFLVLTFEDHLVEMKEAGRRFNSLRTGILQDRYGDYIAVVGRMRNGRIHFHLLVALKQDIRTGIEFDRIAQKDYRSASSTLKDEWAFWGQTAPKYGFGRSELLPIKKSPLAIARYMKRHLSAHRPEDKGIRLVRYSGGAKVARTRFSWHCPRAVAWRKALTTLAEQLGFESTDGFRRMFGRHWAYVLWSIFENRGVDAEPTMDALPVQEESIHSGCPITIGLSVVRGDGILSRTARAPPG